MSVCSRDHISCSHDRLIAAKKLAKADEIVLPGGLGTRHAAAAAITHVTDSLALVVSSSGQVTYFRKGQMFTLFEKSEGRAL